MGRKARLEKATKDWKKALEDKQRLETQITNIVIAIAKRQLEISALKSELTKARTEKLHAVMAKKVMELFIANQKRIKQQRATQIEQFWYFLEAAYFYRVFPDKLIAAQADIDPALSKANIKTTKAKIAKAFYPIKVEFANEP